MGTCYGLKTHIGILSDGTVVPCCLDGEGIINLGKISYETSRDGISVQAVRPSPGGLSVYAELGLNGLSIDYKWDMEGSKIKDAYLRFSFTAAERLGAKRESNWQRQINPAAVTKENFIQAVRTAIREGHDEQELSIPICRIRFPIPNAPGASANCQLNLDLSADGRAEISLGQTAEFGMEMRGGSVRPISRFTNHPKAMIEASTSILSEIAFSLQAAGITLSDILIHAGLGSTVSSTVHQYDKNGSHTSTVTELPADLVNEMASGSEGILVCSDITANWISDIDLNSSESAAGRLGLSLHIPLLSGMKANVYPKTHMENFHFVDRCTRSDRQMAKPYQELPESEQIRLSAYSMILDAGETAEVQITRLPAGYSMSSIRLSSQDPSVASVSGMKVTAVSEGSTVIRAATSDGRYSILCTVSVRQEKSHAGSYH